MDKAISQKIRQVKTTPTKSKIGSLPALCCLSQLVAGSTRRQNRIGRIDAEITGIRGMSVRVGISINQSAAKLSDIFIVCCVITTNFSVLNE